MYIPRSRVFHATREHGEHVVQYGVSISSLLDALEVLQEVLTIPKLPRLSRGGRVGAGESGVPNTALLLKAPELTPKHIYAQNA